MPDKVMVLKVITPEGVVVPEAPVDALTLPTSVGLMGVLYNHAPMAAVLGTGLIRYRHDGSATVIAVSGGFAELDNNRITILADTAELAVSIDGERASAALKRAVERLRSADKGVDRPRAEASKRRAQNRLKALSMISPR